MNLSASDLLILQQYFTRIPVKKAYLFGSRARNEARPESDIDLLLELDHSQPIGMTFFLYKTDLEALLHKKIDLITTGSISRHLKPFIEKDKILIYERVD
jgi:Predicted nucleotidyltransferases